MPLALFLSFRVFQLCMISFLSFWILEMHCQIIYMMPFQFLDVNFPVNTAINFPFNIIFFQYPINVDLLDCHLHSFPRAQVILISARVCLLDSSAYTAGNACGNVQQGRSSDMILTPHSAPVDVCPRTTDAEL